MRVHVLLLLVLAVTSVQAGLIVDPVNTNITAYGFGTVPTVLTLQRDVLEMGCVVPTSGGFVTSCAGVAGYTDLAGSIVGSGGAPHYATPTLAELGVTSWETLGILFNVNEPNNVEQVTLQNLTLTLYGGAVPISFELVGPVDLTDISQGQGGAGFVIRIAADQLGLYTFNDALRVGLAAEIGCNLTGCDVAGQYASGDGPESFSVANIEGGGVPPQEIPEPATAALLGGGLIALAWVLRRRQAS